MDICMRLLGPCSAFPVCQEGWSKDQKIVYNVSTLVAKLCETEEKWMYTFIYILYTSCFKKAKGTGTTVPTCENIGHLRFMHAALAA